MESCFTLDSYCITSDLLNKNFLQNLLQLYCDLKEKKIIKRMKFFPMILSLALLHTYAQPRTTEKDTKSTTSDTVQINNFIVKESLLKNNKIVIIACNTQEKPLENIRGTFMFTVNGFKQDLTLHNGVAVLPQQIDQSTFIYLKHENEINTRGKLYYLIKNENGIKPIKISWWLFIATPLALICIGSIFRRFIVIAIVLIISLFIFNSTNGLNVSTLLDTLFDGLRSIS